MFAPTRLCLSLLSVAVINTMVANHSCCNTITVLTAPSREAVRRHSVNGIDIASQVRADSRLCIQPWAEPGIPPLSTQAAFQSIDILQLPLIG